MVFHRIHEKVLGFISVRIQWSSVKHVSASKADAPPERRLIPEASPALREAFTVLTTSERFSEESVRKAFARIKI